MKQRLQTSLLALVVGFGLLAGSAQHLFSQEQPAQAASQSADKDKAGNFHSKYEKMDAPASENSEDEYRHSASVQFTARLLHMDVETAAKIFEDLNSAIIWIAVIWFLVKVVPKAFRKRSETIQKELVEARKATEEARERLGAVEARLAKLDSEIDAIRKQAEHDSVEDEKRIKATLEEERKRIVESAEQEIEAFGASARRDLKHFAADLAVDRAIQRIHLGADDDKKLIENFAADLANTKGGQN